jgi:transcriptional regulator with XRE-family HTH domain
MQIELRLKSFLKKYGLDYHGVKNELAEVCDVHRHTIGKLLKNEMSNPSLNLLSKICRWILRKKEIEIENGEFDPSILPRELFGSRPAELWLAFGKSRRVTIYLGEYQQSHQDMPHVPAHRSVSRRDAEVESMFIQRLSSTEVMGANRPVVHTRFIPFHYTWKKSDGSDDTVENNVTDDDRDRAIRVYERDVRKRNPNESVIMVGSQRVNYLLECQVANIFGCEPFAQALDNPKVPFYLCYRDFDHSVNSCFGGRHFPPHYETWNKADYNKICEAYEKEHGPIIDHPPSVPGTYYRLDEKGPWQHCPWTKEKEDAGIVLIVRDGDQMDVGVFGFAGSATVAVGRHLMEYPWDFWPEAIDPDTEKKKKGKKAPPPPCTTIVGGLEIGVYLCKVEFTPKVKSRQSYDEGVEENYDVSISTVIPLPVWK